MDPECWVLDVGHWLKGVQGGGGPCLLGWGGNVKARGKLVATFCCHWGWRC